MYNAVNNLLIIFLVQSVKWYCSHFEQYMQWNRKKRKL